MTPPPMLRHPAYAFALLALMTVAAPAQGQDGTLDPTFGVDGWAALNAGTSQSARARDLAVQPDGKIVAAGYASTGSSGGGPSAFALVRYEADGSPDLGFGEAGVVRTAIGESSSVAAVALQPDGRIVAVGSATVEDVTVAALARYLPDGTLDASFGEGGVATSAFGATGASASGVAVQPDGRLVVSGSQRMTDVESHFAVVRLMPDGALDTSFGAGGVASVDLGGRGYALDLALQPDGRIVAVGFVFIYHGVGDYNYQIAVARFTAAGMLDATLGGDGVVRTDVSEYRESANAVALQPDGRIVVGAGVEFDSPHYSFVLLRYTADGALDPTFDGDGVVTAEFYPPSSNGAHDVALLDDGRIMAVGSGYYSSAPKALLARFGPDGAPDPSFGDGGQVETTFPPGRQGYPAAVALLPDGRALVAGLSSHYENGGNIFVSALAVARFTVAGDLDASFGTDGAALAAGIGPGPDYVGALALAQDGRLVVVGKSWAGEDWVLSVARFTAEGAADVSFGEGGVVTMDLDADMDLHAQDVEVLPDGRVLALVNARDQSEGWDALVVRFTADGALDPSWGGTGVVAFPAEESVRAAGMALQPDGHVVVGAWSPDAFVRYRPDGTLDPTFGEGGVATLTAPVDIGDLVVQGDGRIIAAASDGEALGALRLTASGQLDEAFGEGGFALAPAGASGYAAYAYEVALQPDGRIVAAGYVKDDFGTSFAVARLTADGAPDASFGTGGVVTTLVGDGEGGLADALALQPDGRIVAGGYTVTTGDLIATALVRYLPDGSPDPSFGEGGEVLETFYLDGRAFFEGGYRTALAVQPEGGLVMALSNVTVNGPDLTVARFFIGTGTDVEDDGPAAAADALSPAYPNPFRVSTTFRLTLSAPRARVVVEAYDVLGRRVAVLHDGPLTAGPHVLAFDGSSLPAGLYVVRAVGIGFDLAVRATIVR